MSSASLMSEWLVWLLVAGYLANAALNRMFGAESPKQFGDAIRAWCRSRGNVADQAEE